MHAQNLSWALQALHALQHGHSFRSLGNACRVRAFQAYGLDRSACINGRTLKQRVLPVMETIVRAEIKRRLVGARSGAITADVWKDAARRSFLGVTGHFIMEDWTRIKCTLDLVHIRHRKTATELRRLVAQVVDSVSQVLPGILANRSVITLFVCACLSTEN